MGTLAIAFSAPACFSNENCPRTTSWVLGAILTGAGIGLVVLIMAGVTWWRNRRRLRGMLGGAPLDPEWRGCDEPWP